MSHSDDLTLLVMNVLVFVSFNEELKTLSMLSVTPSLLFCYLQIHSVWTSILS